MTKYDVGYIQRTRDYYRAQGYTTDYQWAHYQETPFTGLTRPLAESRIAIISTAMPSDQVAKKLRTVVSAPVEPPPQSLFTDDLSWDKENTHTDDLPSFLPIEQLTQLAREKVIGELAPRFHCVPTEYSKRNTIETDAPEILRRCQQDKVDLALLVPL